MTIIAPIIGVTHIRFGNPTFAFSLGGGLGTEFGVGINDTAVVNGIVWRRHNRNGFAADYMERHFGLYSMVPYLLDPTSASCPLAVIFDDYVMTLLTAGACNFAVGFLDHLTYMVASSLVGVGFQRNALGEWELFVKDAPGGVAAYRYQLALAGVMANVPHRLTMVVDGRDHTVYFFVDGVQVGSYTPVAKLNQMSNTPITSVSGTLGVGPYLRYRALVPLGGNFTTYLHGGGSFGLVRAAVVGWEMAVAP